MGRRLYRRLSCQILQILLVTAANAQIWAGQAEVRGLVLDLDGRPIPGAEVTLLSIDQPGLGPGSVRTDERGRFRVDGLAETRWRLVIEARDFISVDGWVEASNGRSAAVEVWMRPLAEATPAFAESSTSVVRWLEKGNTLLDQGRYAEARREYEKALGALPRSSWPEILRSTARTHYLEGDPDEAIRHLEWAMTVDPEDLLSSRLYSNLSEQLGQGAQAQRFIDSLKGKTVAELEALVDQYAAEVPHLKAGREPPPPRPMAPIQEPMAGRRGFYRVRFRDKSPEGSWQLLLQRLGLDLAEVREIDPAGGRYDLAAESFSVYVPASVSPDSGFGLLVWVSPTPSGGFSSPEMQRALEASGLIWVGADNSGNGRARWYRYLLALDAAHNMQRLYRIDEARVFVGGYSGGGRVTSGLTILYPEVFRGGISMFGCDYPKPLPVPDKPGAHWPAGFPPPTQKILRQVKSTSRIVLLTGELDFNRAQTKKTYLTMVEDGFEQVLLLTVPGLTHYDRPAEEWLTRGFQFLTTSNED